MNILDEDMQMVRDWLATAGAPEYIKGHFENLLSQYEAAEAKVEELQQEVEEKRGACVERDELQEQVESLEADLEARDADSDDALLTVKYWLIDFLHHKRTTKTPREVLRIVEEAVQ